MNQYPERAGFVRGSRTSLAAAIKVEGRGKITREMMVYNALQEKPRSVWELCNDLGLANEIIQPRCSELKGRGIIHATGETRPTPYKNEGEVLSVCAPYSRNMTRPLIHKRHRTEIDKEKVKTALTHLMLLNEKDDFHFNKIKDILTALI